MVCCNMSPIALEGWRLSSDNSTMTVAELLGECTVTREELPKGHRSLEESCPAVMIYGDLSVLFHVCGRNLAPLFWKKCQHWQNQNGVTLVNLKLKSKYALMLWKKASAWLTGTTKDCHNPLLQMPPHTRSTSAGHLASTYLFRLEMTSHFLLIRDWRFLFHNTPFWSFFLNVLSYVHNLV